MQSNCIWHLCKCGSASPNMYTVSYSVCACEHQHLLVKARPGFYQRSGPHYVPKILLQGAQENFPLCAARTLK